MKKEDFKNTISIEDQEASRLFDTGSVAYKKFIHKIAIWFQEILGVKFSLEIPRELWGYGTETWPSIFLAAELKEKNIIQDLHRESQEFPDEVKVPFLYLGHISSNRPGWNGLGASFKSEKAALEAAVGETLERYSLLNFAPEEKECIDSSVAAMKEDFLNPEILAGISKKERQNGHPKFNIDFDDKTTFRWVQGYSLMRGKPTWVPLQLVSFAYQPWRTNKEPLLRLIISGGAASGKTIDDAILHGLLEFIEHDAYMVTWLNKLSPKKIDLESVIDEDFKKILRRVREKRLEFHILSLPTDQPVNVFLAILIDKTGIGPAVSATGGAGLSPAEALWSTTNEIFAHRLNLRKDYERIIKTGIDINFNDPSNIGRSGRLSFWSRKGMEKEIDFLLRGTETKFSDLKDYTPPQANSSEKLKFITNNLKNDKLEAAYVNIIPPGLQNLPIKTVATIIPELQPMHLEEGLPYFSGPRLKEVPIKLGYRPAENINHLPHPFP